MKLRSLEDLMVAQLKTLRGAEEQIQAQLPKLAKFATSSEAIAGLQAQTRDSRSCSGRLTEIADDLDRKLRPRICDPVTGMLEEMRIITSSKNSDPATLDIALLTSAQRLLRHRHNAYRQARALAEENSRARTVEILDDALAEQSKADLELNKQLLALIKPKPESKVVALVEMVVPKVRRSKTPSQVMDRLLGVEPPAPAEIATPEGAGAEEIPDSPA